MSATALLLTAPLLVSSPAAAVSTTCSVDSITYSINPADVAAGATAIDYTGAGGSVAVPDSITCSGQAYSVTSIAGFAFKAHSLSSVAIGNSVTTIGEFAFSQNQMTSLTLGSSVTSIGDQAFSINSLTSVTIPDSVTSIGSFAFELNSLSSVTFGNSVATIGPYSFAFNSLPSVSIPDSVTTVGQKAFAFGVLTSVTLGDSVTTIEKDAFEDNADLVSVTFDGAAPTTITPAGEDASLGTAKGLVVHYLAVFDDANTTPTPGFTTPVWKGYATQIIGPTAVANLVPTISGLAQVTHTLTADAGSQLDPSDATLTYQWNANGQPIAGATHQTFRLTKAQAGETITVTITASSPPLTPQTKTSDPTPYVREKVTSDQLTLDRATATRGGDLGLIGKGLVPGAVYQVAIGLTYVGTVTADEYGEINQTIAVPSTLKTGLQIATITAPNGDIASAVLLIGESAPH